MDENIIISKQSEAQDLDRLIKLHANLAWTNLLESARCLKQMRDTKLYLELGYESFGDYSQKSLNIKERQAYTYINAYENLGERFLQSNASLGITKLALLSGITPEDRDEIVESNDIAGMTVEEVRALVAENDNKGEQIEMLTVERDESEKAKSILENEIAKLTAELEAEKNKPVEVAVSEPSSAEIAKIKADALVSAEKSKAKELKSLEKKLNKAHQKELEELKEKNKLDNAGTLKEYEERLSSAEQDRQEALKAASDLEKKLSVVGRPETVKFEFYFEELKADFNKICESITELKKTDAETAEKFKNAFVAATKAMQKAAEGL